MFSALCLQLQQEGHLASGCLASALTSLRSAHVGQEGRFYSGFFELAIAIERICKLTLILDHLASHALAAPGSAAVRGYGHDLLALVARVDALHGGKATPMPGSLERRVLEFLSEFAKTARYANLDAIASGAKPTGLLAEWERLLLDVYKTYVSKKMKERLEEHADLAVQARRSHSIVLGHGLAGKLMDLRDWFHMPNVHDAASRHVIWVIVRLIAPILEALRAASDRAQRTNLQLDNTIMHVPNMSEFFSFMWPERKYVLRKKRWP